MTRVNPSAGTYWNPAIAGSLRPREPGWGAAGRRIVPALVLMLAISLLCPAPAAAQASHLLIVAGLSGDPEHGELFRTWGASLEDAAVQRMGVPRANVTFLADDPSKDPGHISGKSTREEIARAFGTLASAAADDDTVLIVLFGHGTFDGSVARFNLPGPDMSATDFVPLLAKIRSRRIAFVNTASASGPFVEALSGPGRMIITATRNGAERFATQFGGAFVDAFDNTAADVDRDGRVTLLEAFEYARADVARIYEREGLLQTEHALLDDNGDKEGSAEPGPQAKDGRVAAILGLGTATADAVPAGANEALRALYAQRRDLERRVESLKLLKDSLDPARYASELEDLLTELARKTKEIKDAGGTR